MSTVEQLEAERLSDDHADEALRNYVRALARRLAREDHKAGVAARNSRPEHLSDLQTNLDDASLPVTYQPEVSQ